MTVTRTLRGLLRGGFTVSERPQPLPGDLRLGWGVALLILVLGASRGQRASIQKIHFLAHLARAKVTRDQTRAVMKRTIGPQALSVRVEPWVNRAMAFAIAEGVAVMRDGKAAALTDAGKAVHRDIVAMPILDEEKAFLAEVGPRATEKVVEQIMKMEQF